MSSPPSVPPAQAWDPLPIAAWDADAARHLLRRAGWSAPPDQVGAAVAEGLSRTLDRLFPLPPSFPTEPPSIAALAAEAPALAEEVRLAPPEEKQRLRREERERSRAALLDLTLEWLAYAAAPANSAFAKWTLFLGDTYVVGFEKVGRSPLIFRHLQVLARSALGTAPQLSKAVLRSPAMIVYLDLAENKRGAPNENFARELFELFLLGEGNYTERDIKEAARAFTGYRVRPDGEPTYIPRQHDDGWKTVFGHSGYFNGDNVIDLAYGLPAAGAYLPRKLVRFYLADEPLPPEYLSVLGGLWAAQGYDLRWLARRFFGSRLFFGPEFRGNFIKSPVQFYLALLQDLQLDEVPLPRYVVNPLRQMGQVLYNPPNVRGWVGGRNWINSGSLAARRSLVDSCFQAIDEDNLTADEQRAVAAARDRGRDAFSVMDEQLEPFAALEPDDAVAALARRFLPFAPPPAVARGLRRYLAAEGPSPHDHLRRVRLALRVLLESPAYQLC